MNHIAPIKTKDNEGRLYRAQIACPACQHLESPVLETRGRFNADRIVRRRRCESCSHRFTTEEVYAGQTVPVRAMLENVSRSQKSIAWLTEKLGEMERMLRAVRP